MGIELSSPVEEIVHAAQGTSGGEQMTAALFCFSGCMSKVRDVVKSCATDGGGYASTSEQRLSAPECRRAEAALCGCLLVSFDFYKAKADALDRASSTKANFFSS